MSRLRALLHVAIFLLPLTFHTSAVSATDASRSGIITASRGDVLLGRPSGRIAASVSMPLAEGDTVIARAGATCTGFTTWGEAFSLEGPAELVATAASKGALDSVQQWIARQISLWNGESHRHFLTARAGRDWEHRRAACAPISPAAGGRVRPGESRFSWVTVPGVDRYTVTLALPDGREEEHSVLGHELVISGLSSDAEYLWRVTPALACWPTVTEWSDFRTLSEQEERSLDESVKRLPDLEAGVLFLSTGLHEEAVYRFDAVAESQANRPSALLWRARALAEMGLDGDAYQDLVKATTEAAAH